MTAVGSGAVPAAGSNVAGGLRRVRVETLVALGLAVLLGVLVLLPILAVLSGALREPAGFSTRFIVNVLSSTRVLTNTLLVGATTTSCAIALGGGLALILVRIATPGRALLEQIVILPLYVTPLLTAIAWSWLGSPRGGLINLAAVAAGLPPLVDLHSPSGVIFVASLAYAPVAFLLIGGALKAMDPTLEDCARLHGATAVQAFRRVTIPLVLPATLGAAILIFVQAIGLFSVPAVLGMPSGFYVAGTEIYRLLSTYPPRIGQAAGWGLILLVVTAILVWLQARILNRWSFVTVTGKAFRPRLLSPGRWGWALAGLAWLYVGLAVALPILTLLWAALVNFITADPRLMAFDLRHFSYVLFSYPKTGIATRNSLVLAGLAATLICGLSLLIGWCVVRGRSRASSLLDQIGMMPLAIPPMVLALGILWTYVGLRWLPIYGTIGILLLAYVTHYLPIGLRAASGALRQLHPELEDAARVSGAGFLATLTRVVLPLVRPTMVATWTLLFVLCLQEVSSSILLYSSGSTVLSVAVFDLWEAGNVNALAALSVLQLAITFAVLLLVAGLRRREVGA
jgi:iron(III) transport system permease protein